MTGAAVRDPGLQPERTRLAWRRTTLTATVVTVLAARSAFQDGERAVGLVACAWCVLVWLGLLAVAHRRIHELAGDPVDPPRLMPWAAAVGTLCAVGLAVCAAVVVF